MNKDKYFHIFLGAAFVVVAAAAVYGIIYFQTKTKESQTRSKEMESRLAVSEPKIIVPDVDCNLKLPNGVKNRYYIEFSSGDIEKDKSAVDKLIAGVDSKIMYRNDSRYPVAPDSLTTQRQVNFSVLIPQTQFKTVSTAIKKLSDSPDILNNESLNEELEANVRNSCIAWLDAIKQASQQEKMYLEQMQTDITYENKKDIINILTSLRQQSTANQGAIDNLIRDFDKAELNINIREIIG